MPRGHYHRASEADRARILFLHHKGLTVRAIVEELQRLGVAVPRATSAACAARSSSI